MAGGLKLAAGERVKLSLTGASLLRAAFYAYGAPLLGLLLASGLVYLLAAASNDAVAVLWALGGMGGGAAVGGYMARRDACINALAPTVSGRADPVAAETAK